MERIPLFSLDETDPREQALRPWYTPPILEFKIIKALERLYEWKLATAHKTKYARASDSKGRQAGCCEIEQAKKTGCLGLPK